MILGDSFQIDNFTDSLNTLSLKNTGITICEFKENKWKVLTINDFAHLAD
jgi:broad specificity phosphatase PhoE